MAICNGAQGLKLLPPHKSLRLDLRRHLLNDFAAEPKDLQGLIWLSLTDIELCCLIILGDEVFLFFQHSRFTWGRPYHDNIIKVIILHSWLLNRFSLPLIPPALRINILQFLESNILASDFLQDFVLGLADVIH